MSQVVKCIISPQKLPCSILSAGGRVEWSRKKGGRGWYSEKMEVEDGQTGPGMKQLG